MCESVRGERGRLEGMERKEGVERGLLRGLKLSERGERGSLEGREGKERVERRVLRGLEMSGKGGGKVWNGERERRSGKDGSERAGSE